MRRFLHWVLSRFTTRQIIAIGATLFVLDLLIPDPIPFLDEILLAVGTFLLARRSASDKV